MAKLPYGSDEPFGYLYSRMSPPDPAEAGSRGGIADVFGIPEALLVGSSARRPAVQVAASPDASLSDPRSDPWSLINLIGAMQGMEQSADGTLNTPDGRSFGGSNLTGPGIDPDFVYQPSPHDPVGVTPLPAVWPNKQAVPSAPVGNAPPERRPLSPEEQAKNLAIARDAMSKPEVLAFMRAITTGETTTGDYNVLRGGATFEGWNYPKEKQRAAGAYQIMPKTYDGMSDKLGLKDFSPDTQDLMAAWLITQFKAHEPLLRGDLDGAIGKLRGTWPSLPGGDQPNVHTRSFPDRYRAHLDRLRRE